MPRSSSPRRWWTATDRDIARLAIPALGALIAEPLYVLADTAVVGHIGTAELAGLALAGQTLLTLHAVMIFLAYGTTASVSRLLGADRRRDAAAQAVQSIWLAAAIGIAAAIALRTGSDPLLRLLGGDGEVLVHARTYLHISHLGLPAMLVTLATVGYLRGLQDTVRPFLVAVATAIANLVIELVLIFGLGFGIGASALATVIAQYAGAAVLVWWVAGLVREHRVAMAPHLGSLRSQARVAGDLFLRTAALRGSFTVAVAAAARLGNTELAAHEIAFQLWMFVALALDAVALAAQAMIGRFLGADDAAGAIAAARRMLGWGLATGLAASGVMAATIPVLPHVFSDDPAVISLTGFLMIHLALMQPINGVVFTLDGILIGAGDMAFLAWAMVGAAAVFIPLALAVPALGWGIGWLWGAIWVLMVGRAGALVVRFGSRRWVVTGSG